MAPSYKFVLWDLHEGRFLSRTRNAANPLRNGIEKVDQGCLFSYPNICHNLVLEEGK